MKRVGILGGTFDPPHIGHLIIAEETRIALLLDEIWFIPTYSPPHKKAANMDAMVRVEMLRKAVNDNPNFIINTIEIERAGTSYTIDTIQLLKQQYPNVEFFFIIGADMIEYLPKWHKINELTKLITFVGVNRPGYTMDSSYPIKRIAVPDINIASTLIRNRLLRNETVNYLITNQVYNYIKEHQLYGAR